MTSESSCFGGRDPPALVDFGQAGRIWQASPAGDSYVAAVSIWAKE